jgi:hypothetical protein
LAFGDALTFRSPHLNHPSRPGSPNVQHALLRHEHARQRRLPCDLAPGSERHQQRAKQQRAERRRGEAGCSANANGAQK